MKKIQELLIVAAIAVLLIAVITVGAAPRTESQTTSTPSAQDPLRTITVVGTGKVNLVPDVAQVNVGAEVRADTVSEAKAEVDRQRVAIRA